MKSGVKVKKNYLGLSGIVYPELCLAFKKKKKKKRQVLLAITCLFHLLITNHAVSNTGIISNFLSFFLFFFFCLFASLSFKFG